MRKSNFFAATLLVCAACVSCSSDFEAQEENLLNFQDVLQGETISLPSVEKTLGACDESTVLYTSSNGSIMLHGNSFAVGDTLYYPIDVNEDLVVRRWVKNENGGRNVISPLAAYLVVDTINSVAKVRTYAPDFRYLRNIKMETSEFYQKIPFGACFSGIFIESDINGEILGGRIYYAGNQTRKIRPSTATICGHSYVQRGFDECFSFNIMNCIETRDFSWKDYLGPDSENFYCPCSMCASDPCICQFCSNCSQRYGECSCTDDPDFCVDCERSPCICEKCPKCGGTIATCSCEDGIGVGYHAPR